MLDLLISLTLATTQTHTQATPAPKCPEGQTYNPETKKCEAYRGGGRRQ
jgi:hypothetical protein